MTLPFNLNPLKECLQETCLLIDRSLQIASRPTLPGVSPPRHLYLIGNLKHLTSLSHRVALELPILERVINHCSAGAQMRLLVKIQEYLHCLTDYQTELSSLLTNICEASDAPLVDLDALSETALQVSFANLYTSGRFRGGANKSGGNGLKSPTIPSNGQNQSQASSSGVPGNQSSSNLAPRMPPITTSPSLAQTLSMDESGGPLQTPTTSEPQSIYNMTRPRPPFLDNTNAKHIVKGNFMTLSARPLTVEPGEWLAHQTFEHFRVLWHFVNIVHNREDDGSSICNAKTCPRMTAGPNHGFTWLNSNKQPTELSAWEYMQLVYRWVHGKIENESVFPTDQNTVSFASNPSLSNGGNNGNSNGSRFRSETATHHTSEGDQPNPDLESKWVGWSSGFPHDFKDICRSIFRQMFRVYAHLYWDHFVEPFYHMGSEKALNSCFSHFVLTATVCDMLKPHDMEAMQSLIDLWAANGTFPPESAAYAMANPRNGEKLLGLATT